MVDQVRGGTEAGRADREEKEAQAGGPSDDDDDRPAGNPCSPGYIIPSVHRWRARGHSHYDPLSGAPGEALMAVLHECGHALYVAGLPAAHRRQPVGAAPGHDRPREPEPVDRNACLPVARLRRPLRHGCSRTNSAKRARGIRTDCTRCSRMSSQASRASRQTRSPTRCTSSFATGVKPQCSTARSTRPTCRTPSTTPWRRCSESAPGIRVKGAFKIRTGTLMEGWAYFPTYVLGALMGCTAGRDHVGLSWPDLDGDLARGDFAPLARWLRENVHSRGCFDPSADALLEHATGPPARYRVVPAAFWNAVTCQAGHDVRPSFGDFMRTAAGGAERSGLAFDPASRPGDIRASVGDCPSSRETGGCVQRPSLAVPPRGPVQMSSCRLIVLHQKKSWRVRSGRARNPDALPGPRQSRNGLVKQRLSLRRRYLQILAFPARRQAE